VSASKTGPVPKRWVIKLGTGILTDSHGHIDFSQIDQLGAQVVELRKRGHEVHIVSPPKWPSSRPAPPSASRAS
jgi:glutamate 5-kinase